MLLPILEAGIATGKAQVVRLGMAEVDRPLIDFGGDDHLRCGGGVVVAQGIGRPR